MKFAEQNELVFGRITVLINLVIRSSLSNKSNTEHEK
jgi:hypothetical protein